MLFLLGLAAFTPRVQANRLEPPKLPFEFALMPTAGFAEKEAKLGLWFPYGTEQRPVILVVSVLDTTDANIKVSDLNRLQTIDQKILSQRRSISNIKKSTSTQCSQDSKQLCFESVYQESFYNETIRERTYFVKRDARHTIVVTLSFPTYIAHKIDSNIQSWLKSLQGPHRFSTSTTQIFNDIWSHFVPIGHAEETISDSHDETQKLPINNESTVGSCSSFGRQSLDCLGSVAKGFFVDGLVGDASFLGTAAKETARFAGSTNPISGMAMRYAGIKTTQQQLQEGAVKITNAFKQYGPTVVEGVKEFSKNPAVNMSIALDKVRQIMGNITCQQASGFMCQIVGQVGYEVAITAIIGFVTAGVGVGAKGAQLVAEISARYGPKVAANFEKFLGALSKFEDKSKTETQIADSNTKPRPNTFGPDLTRREELIDEYVPKHTVEAMGGPEEVTDEVLNFHLPANMEPWNSEIKRNPVVSSPSPSPNMSARTQPLSRTEQAKALGLTEQQIEDARAGGVPEISINQLASPAGQDRQLERSNLIRNFMERHQLQASDGIVLMEDDPVMVAQATRLQERYAQLGKEPPIIIAGHGTPTDLLLDYEQTNANLGGDSKYKFSNERIGGFELLNVMSQLGITVGNRDVVYLSCYGGNACGLSRVVPNNNVYSAPDSTSVFSNSGGFLGTNAATSESWNRAINQYSGPTIRTEGSIFGNGMIEWNNGRIIRQLGNE